MRVVPCRVGREAARRTVLETLIHRQYDHFARAAETSMHENTGEISLGARIVRFVCGKDFLDALRNLHCSNPEKVLRK
jgi:hypothetical protein